MYGFARVPLLFVCPLLVFACGDDTVAGSGSNSGTGISSASASASATATATATATNSASGTTSTGGTVSQSGSSTDDSGTASATGSSTGSTLKLDVGFEETTSTTDEPVEGCTKVDLLFVIDDSGSMSDQQNKLTDAFPSFMATIDEQLVQMKGVDYRVGVLSTDMAGPDMCIFISCGQGHRGRLQHASDRLNCDTVPDGKWIKEGPVEAVSDEFRCIASMDGGEFNEMPLEALRAGLIDRVQDQEAYNDGFLRDDALLVMVMITDEDDQSVMEIPSTWELLPPPKSTPVIEYQQLFVQLKGGEKDRFVAVAITGPKDTSCGDGEDPLAVKAPRIHQFLELNSPNSYWGNICEEDFTAPLKEALEVIKASCETFPPV